MDRISDLVASVRANPGVCQEIRDQWGEPVFFAVEPAVYNKYVRQHIRGTSGRVGQQPKAPTLRKPRPAAKLSYRQRHKRTSS